jgi:outer membrane protein
MQNNNNRNKKERKSFRALSALLFASVFFSTPAFAKLSAEQIKVYTSADEGQRVHFLIGRAKLGQYKLTTELLQAVPLQGPHAANRVLYITGLNLRTQGNLTGAVEKFRAALASDPSLTLVRTDLAQTLIELGQSDSAKHHLKLLEAEAPTPQQAQSIRGAIETIDEKKPVKVNGYISLAPTTNVNSGSNHSTVTSRNPALADSPILEITDSQKKPGIGIAAGLSLGYQKRLGNHLEAVLTADLDGRIYDNYLYNGISLGQTAELRYHVANGYFGIGAIADQSIDPNKPDAIYKNINYHSYGPRISMRHSIGQKNQLSASAVYEWRKFATGAPFDSIDYRGDVTWNHAFDASFNAGLTIGYEKLTSGINFNSFGTGFMGISTYKELPFGITLGTNLQARYTAFDAMNPYAFITREDYRGTASISVTKRDLNFMGFAPAVSYTYNRNFSNIELWDFDSHNVDFRFTKDF